MDLVISAVESVIVDCVNGGKYVGFPAENVKAEDILRLVSNRVNGDFSVVDKIYVNMGPGSFTGIRASMALVVGLTAGKNNQVVPFTTFDAFEYDKLTAGIVLAVNGFSNFVYVRYIKNRKIIQECITIDDLLALEKSGKIILTYSSELIERLQSCGGNPKQVELNLENVVKKHLKGSLEKINFEPVYLRLSQAELQRKENKK